MLQSQSFLWFNSVGLFRIYLNVEKVRGLQSQGVKGDAVVGLPRILDNTGSEVPRLSRRVNNMAKSTPSLDLTSSDNQEVMPLLEYRL